MFLKLYMMILLITVLISCQNVDSLVEQIADKNSVQCQSIGFVGSQSKVYKIFENLKSKASEEELLKLIKHDNSAVVGYSAYALIDRGLIEPSELLEQFFNEKEGVSTFCGCLMINETLSSLIYHRNWRKRAQSDVDLKEYKVDDSKELLKMDSIILYAENPEHILLNRAFENRIYSDQYKIQIEELAFNKEDFYALKYVFNNLLNRNEKRLRVALNNVLKKEEIYINQFEQANEMLNYIRDTIESI